MAILLGFAGLLCMTQDPIVTDRPDFTESSVVVPLGTIQYESGVTYTVDGNGRSFQAPELLIRTSLGSRAEIRLGLPSHTWSHELRGWDDVYLGAKFQIGPFLDGTGFALIPAVMIPVGSDGLRSPSVSPEVKAVWSRELSDETSLAGMLYASYVEERTFWQHTVSFGMPVADGIGAFVEHVLDVAHRLRPAHTLHAGLTYRPRPNMQYDVHLGLGLNREAPRAFIAGGFSVRH